MATVISDIYLRKFGHTLSRYIHTSPRVRLVHKESIAVISEIAPGTTDMIQFTPVRKIIRGSGGFVCAFCDTVLVGREGCHHTRVMKTLRKDDDLSSEGETGGERTDPGEELLVDDSNHLDDNVGDMEMDHNGSGQGDREMDVDESVEDHKSHLPLCPVNCARSLKVDQQVARCAASRERYVLTAPSTCQKCGAHRNPKSRSSWEGVIMCTLGPCALDVENFRCAREGCQSVIETEGREHCILLLKNTAATHALLRRELMGVALSNGTLNGRLTHFHSQLISIQQAGIIGASPECRSVCTLHNLCNVMLKLMTMDPEKSLFSCDTCDMPDFQHGFRRPAYALMGYRKSKQVSLQNFVEICTSIPSSSEGAINPRTCRPLTTLIRRTDTVSILLKAVKGDDLEVTKGNISDFAAAIRLVSEDTILPQFCAASICGRTKNDYYEDLGYKTVLRAVRNVTTSLFHDNTLLLRLLKPLDTFIRRCIHENEVSYLRRLGAIGDSGIDDIMNGMVTQRNLPHDLRALIHSLQGPFYAEIILSGACWIPQLRGNSSNAMVMESRKNALREVMDMYVMVVKGPVTQFVKRGDIRSLRTLGTACRITSPTALLKLLTDPSLMTTNMELSATNLLTSCRIIQASLFNIVEVERNVSTEIGQIARRAFGELFSSAARVVHLFYSFYDNIPSTHSSAKYAEDWKTDDVKKLLGTMKSRFYRNGQSSPEKPFLEACRSGFYFPNQSQLRPLPFDSDNVKTDGKLVPCTKKYEQNQKSYTPGSVTVSCYCADTITYGYKVLSREEGTKTILDTVISRFPTMPWWIIYDFSCGLYQSAVHSLSWAIENTRIVSDKFHAKNHTCAPGFFPSAYTELDHANTVAHEQRNRGIAQLCKSLRNSSQEFYVGLLAYHTIIMNIRGKARTTTGYRNRDRLLSNFDVEWCYFHCLKLDCSCCGDHDDQQLTGNAV